MAKLLTRIIIINQSITSCTFPSHWKYVVTPVPKSRKNPALTNFRPISVLQIFSKALERVIHDQLVSGMTCFHHISLAFDQVILCRMYFCTYVVDSWHKAIDAHKGCCGWISGHGEGL